MPFPDAHDRELFEALDQGFCTIEIIFDHQQRPADYRFIDVNPAFEVTRTMAPSRPPVTTMREPGSLYLAALVSRFDRTCAIRALSTLRSSSRQADRSRAAACSPGERSSRHPSGDEDVIHVC